MKKHGVGSVRTGSFIFACFRATILVLKLPGVASTFFRVVQLTDHFPSCGSGRAQREFVAWCGVDTLTLQHVSVRFLMLCQHDGKRPPMCFCVAVCCFDMFSLMVLVTTFFSDWCCVGTNSDHNTGFPCRGSGRNAKHICLTTREHCQSSAALLTLSSIPPSCLHSTKRKQGFSRRSQEEHLREIGPPKHQNNCFGKNFGRPSLCSWTRDRRNTSWPEHLATCRASEAPGSITKRVEEQVESVDVSVPFHSRGVCCCSDTSYPRSDCSRCFMSASVPVPRIEQTEVVSLVPERTPGSIGVR